MTAIAGIMAISVSAQQGPYKMTLEDCLRYAMDNSYNRQSQQLDEQSADLTYDQSRMERLPSLSASVSENVSNSKENNGTLSGSYGVNASVTLYQGGSISNTIKQNGLYVEQAAAKTAVYDNELTIQILQSFLTILGNQELLSYQGAVIKASEEQFAQGEIRLKAGEILESDYMMLEAQLASDRNNLTETKAGLDNSLLTLKSLLSMDMNTELSIVYPDATAISAMTVVPTQDYVTQRAMATLPDIAILQYGVDIAKTGVSIARSGYYPTLSLTGGIGSGHSQNFSNYGTQLSNKFNQQAGLSLSIPIFNKNRTKTSVNKSRIVLQQAELEQKQSSLNILQTVITEYNNVSTALSTYRSSEVKERAYGKTYEVYRSQFAQGAITVVDLLQQQNNYISALNDYVQSKYGFMLKRKMLDVYTGETITM